VVFTSADAATAVVDNWEPQDGLSLRPQDGESDRQFSGITVEARVLHRKQFVQSSRR
jgi:hypothetical protein